LRRWAANCKQPEHKGITVIKLPETPAGIAALIGSNYASMLQSGDEPTADTKYVLSIHDLLSAFAELERESEDEAPGSTGEAAELKTVVADAIAVMCANGDLPGEFEDVADWIALGALPIQAVKYEDGNGALRQSPEKCGKFSEPGVPAAVWLNGKRYVLDAEQDKVIADLEDMIVFKDAAISNLGVLIDELRASQPDNGQQHTPEIGQ
jgi:hypothetical protein